MLVGVYGVALYLFVYIPILVELRLKNKDGERC